MKKLLTLFLMTSACLSVSAQVISVNFFRNKDTGGTRWNSSLAPASSAGVYAATNWNNMDSTIAIQAAPQALNLGDGSASGANVTWTSTSGDESVDSIGTGPNPLTMTSDERIFKDYLESGTSQGDAVSVTINGLSSVFTSAGYDAYVYFDQNSSRSEDQLFSITGGADIYTQVPGDTDFTGTFTQATGTTVGTATSGNYVLWSGLTGSSFTLSTEAFSQNTAGQWNAGISGIQIVAIPEPSHVAVFAGAVALTVILLRRRRN